MFIGIAGPICSGKRTIADFLISNHNFKRLRLRSHADKSSEDQDFDALDTLAATPPVNDIHDLTNGIQAVKLKNDGDVWFQTMDEMVDYVTKRWQDNFVTVDIWREEDLEPVAKRPFFLLISVDAPVSVRWKRFHERYTIENDLFT